MAAAQGPKHSSPSRNDSRARYVIPCGKQCRCLRHVLSCAGGEGSDRLTQIPTIVGYNDTFFYLDFSANSISTFHKRSWLTYSWAEILILKQNNVRKLHKDSFEGLLLLQHLDLSSNKIHTIARHVFEPVPFLQSLFLSNNPLSNFSDTSFFQLAALKHLMIRFLLYGHGNPRHKTSFRSTYFLQTTMKNMNIHHFTVFYVYLLMISNKRSLT
ncbi:hypothetical protein NDU88_003340 [Pleurodeles waltl]|uniref:Uncharacterized protein n=1 Tax=Pleurodeles waltl TaxID=8319 RepID=A0AAV7Q8P2_PLEWA|nr:hypothetical protein NDU88_003340 [Pleurodeles waltl]